LFDVLKKLIEIQNKILLKIQKILDNKNRNRNKRENVKIVASSLNELNVRKENDLIEKSIIKLEQEELDKIVAQNSYSRSNFNNQKSAKINMEVIFQNLANKIFLEYPIIDIVNLPKFKFNDKIYGDKYYLNHLINRYGYETNSEILRVTYFERNKTQSNDFRKFNDLKRVIYFALNYDEMEDKKTATITQFVEKNEIKFEIPKKTGNILLKHLYSYYSFLEFRLIRLNINQIENKYKNEDLSQNKIDKLNNFFKKNSAKFIKIPKRNYEMSYLEYWVTAITRVICRFISNTDEDHLLVDTIRKAFHVYPETFKDDKATEELEKKLEALKIRNKFVVFVHYLLDTACSRYLEK
jgi:hypothetical protein